jgi:hypothetical protein
MRDFRQQARCKCRAALAPDTRREYERGMKKLFAWPLAVFLAGAPLAAVAQNNDAAYCAALSDTYQKYLGSNSGRRFTSDLPAEVAMSKCKAGDTASGIPVLEGRLRDAKFTLPPRG